MDRNRDTYFLKKNNQRGNAPRKGTLNGRKALNQITTVNVLHIFT